MRDRDPTTGGSVDCGPVDRPPAVDSAGHAPSVMPLQLPADVYAFTGRTDASA